MTPEQDRNADSFRRGESQTQNIAALINLWSRGDPARAPSIDTRQIFTAIEAEIVPRLVLATERMRRKSPLPVIAPKSIKPADQELFLEILMFGGARDAAAIATDLRARGVPLEGVLIDLLAWSARKLGEMWDADTCSFSDVTIGLCRLHEILHQITGDNSSENETKSLGNLSILIGNAPDEQHVFATVIVAEIFRRDGWAVHCEPGSNQETLMKAAAENRFDMIGLSASTHEKCALLPPLIRSLKSVSRNADALVMVGGHIFTSNPGLADNMDADIVARDGLSAPQLARKMLANA